MLLLRYTQDSWGIINSVVCCRDIQNALLDDYVLQKAVEWNIKGKTLFSVSLSYYINFCFLVGGVTISI